MSDDLKLPSLADWQRLFDDKAYWQQSPDAHFTELSGWPMTCSVRAPSTWRSGRS